MRMPVICIAETSLISFVLALAGCATTKEDVFPKDMRPMSAVYDDHFAKLRTRGIEGARVLFKEERTAPPTETTGSSELPNASPGQRGGFEGTHPQLAGYTREAHNEIEALFPVLPNPQLIMYVFPHLGEDGAPIPGYAAEAHDLIALDSYIRHFPMNYEPPLERIRRRGRLTFSTHIASLLPLHGRSIGTGHPGCVFFNRAGELVTFDPLNRQDRKKTPTC